MSLSSESREFVRVAGVGSEKRAETPEHRTVVANRGLNSSSKRGMNANRHQPASIRVRENSREATTAHSPWRKPGVTILSNPLSREPATASVRVAGVGSEKRAETPERRAVVANRGLICGLPLAATRGHGFATIAFALRQFARNQHAATHFAAFLLAMFAAGFASPAYAYQDNYKDESKEKATAPDSPLTKLIEDLESRDLTRKRDAAYALAKPNIDALPALKSLTAVLKNERDDQVWNQSAMAVANIGSAAKPAIPALIRSLANYNKQRRYRAAYALGKIGEPAIDELRKALESGKSDARASAALALGWIKSANDAIPELTRGLSDDDDRVRKNCGAALLNIGAATESDLRTALQNEKTPFPESIISVMGRLGALDSASITAIEKFLNDKRPTARSAAFTALLTIGNEPARVEELLHRSLSDDSEDVRAAGLLAIRRKVIPPAAALAALTKILNEQDANPAAAATAAQGLGLLGSAAAPVLPQLVNGLLNSGSDDENAVGTFSKALIRIGPAAVEPLLTADTKTDDAEERIASTLRGIGPRAIPALTTAMNNKQPSVRLSAIRALGGIPGLPDDAFQSIVAQISADDAELRAAAAQAIGAAKKSVARFPDTRKTLAKLVSDDSVTNVKLTALNALVRTLNSSAKSSDAKTSADKNDNDKAVEIVRAALQTSLNSDRPELQAGGYAALADAPQLAQNFLPQLVEGLNATAPETVEACCLALSAIDPKRLRESQQADSLAAAFTDLLNHSSRTVVLASAQAIATIKLAREDAPEKLQQLLAHADERIVRASIEGLAGQGQRSRSVFPALLKLQNHPKSSIRESVARALRHIEPDAEKIVPPLIAMLEDDEWTVRREVAQELGELGESSVAAVPKLFSLLSSEDDKDAARNALREIDAANADAVPVLTEGLRSRDQRRQYYAVFLLQKVGASAAEALPDLRKAREKSDSRRFKGSVDRAIKTIERAIKESDEQQEESNSGG